MARDVCTTSVTTILCMSKPFLLLQLRPEDEASHDEYHAFLRYGKLSEDGVHRVRIEEGNVPSIDLDAYAGVFVGGGPWNVSDAEEKKSEAQRRAEVWLTALLKEVVSRDVPYLGMCYGLGALCVAQDGVVSKERYGEPAGAVTISLTEDGMKDPLLVGLPETFRAFCGHKEACQMVPHGAILLAQSDTCPVQMIRFKRNVYAVQFHTELDAQGLEVRVRAYLHHGYFKPEEADTLVAMARAECVTAPMTILERFVARYGGTI